MAAPEALEVAESVPHITLLQPIPESVQFTPLFCESFCTVAVKLWLPLVGTLTGTGDTVTTMAAGAAARVIVAAADLVPSETEAAFSVIVAVLGTLSGAV
jgi:hypothetical protein